MVRDRDASAPAPFSGVLEPATFHAAAAHDEALARLEWLVGERQRCGLVLAEAGMGKSHLAVAAARRLGGLGAEVAVLSLAGLPDGEWIRPDLTSARHRGGGRAGRPLSAPHRKAAAGPDRRTSSSAA
jgi:hypothetical protein